MLPGQIAKNGTEHAEQAALFCWAAMCGPQINELRLMFAIPNGGLRDKITAARLKAEGVKPGVSDVFLPVARMGLNGLFIEMKRRTGKPCDIKDEQRDFIRAMREQDFGAFVCFGWEHAANLVEAYLCNQGYALDLGDAGEVVARGVSIDRRIGPWSKLSL